MTKNKKGLLLGAAALIVLIGVFALVYTQLVQKPVQGGKEIMVEVVFADQSAKTHTLNTTQEYLREALDEQELVQGKEGDFGLFIETVDGVTAQESKKEWWRLTKSGEMLNTSADQTPIADGDHYELTLTTGW